MPNVPKANHETEISARTVLGWLASVAKDVKAIWAVMALLIAMLYFIYGHFAKASEHQALVCSVIHQNKINNEMIFASEKVKTALGLLSTNLGSEVNLSAGYVAKEVSNAANEIGAAIDRVNKARAELEAKGIKGDQECES